MSRTTFSSRIALNSARRLFLLALTFLLASCGGAAASEPPAESPISIEPTQIQPLMTAVPTSPPVIAVTAQPAIPERRRLTLEYPPRIRAGDSDIVRLTLEVDENGNITPTVVVEGNVTTGEVIEIPNLYETHNVVAQARFDIAGVEVSPPDLSSQTLFPGQTVRFIWSIRPTEVGIYRGTVWLYLEFADKVSGEKSQRALSAQTVEIEAVNLFGVPARVVRVVGGIGSVVGAVVGFPFFEDVVKFSLRRRKKRR